MINKVTLLNVDNWMNYHAPNDFQQVSLQNLRKSAKQFARDILINCPDCADTSAALRLLKQALMTANQSIILNEVD